MKKILLAVLFTYSVQITFGQVSGNINYQNQVQYPENNIELAVPQNMNITIKGMANLTADNFVAIFSVSQSGKTTTEVSELMDNRINKTLSDLKTKLGVESFVDMISFVPIYEFEVSKKIFSKKTYNEVPKGFELKKNIHIKYKDAKLLDEIIATLANSEIYDLVRVDYFSDKIESTKLEMMNKSKLLLQEKIKNYKQILSTKIDSSEQKLVDGFRIIYPVEMYKSYQAYSNSDISLKTVGAINQVEKSTTLYYQPILNKEFDFVINATILEPVIQIMYEIKLEINTAKLIKASSKDYYIMTTNGDLKKIDLKN